MKRKVNVWDYAGKIAEALSQGILATTKADGQVNTMTIGWGTLGIEWGKPICTVYVRQSRHTKAMLEKNGEFTVNIALAFDHRPVLGVIHVPVTGETYWAAKGMGAWREKDGSIEQISVSDRTDGLIVMASRSFGDARLDALLEEKAHRIAEEINSGSSLKGCRIAEGRADVYYRFGPTMEWDTCAMQCICEEAGAILRMLDGYDSEMFYNRTHTRNDQGFYIINHLESKLTNKTDKKGK